MAKFYFSQFEIHIFFVTIKSFALFFLLPIFCAVVQSPMELSLIAYKNGIVWFEFSQSIELDDSWSYFYLITYIRKVYLKLDEL